MKRRAPNLVTSLIVLVLALLGLLAVFVLGGCSTADVDKAIATQRAEAAVTGEAAKAANAEKNRIAQLVQEAKDAARDTKELEAKLAEATAVAAKLERDKALHDAVADALEKQRDAAGNIGKQVGEGAQAVAPFLPAPWGEIVGAAGLLIAGLSEKKRRAEAAASTEAGGTLSTAIASGLIPLSAEAKQRLAAAQSPAAKAVVKKWQAAYSDAMTIAAPVGNPTP